jgi:hypothetical protein
MLELLKMNHPNLQKPKYCPLNILPNALNIPYNLKKNILKFLSKIQLQHVLAQHPLIKGVNKIIDATQILSINVYSRTFSRYFNCKFPKIMKIVF